MLINTIVKTEQDIINAGIKHGDAFVCPTCGAPGRIDITTKSGEPVEFSLSVWWNTHSKSWECSECYLK